MPSPAPKKRYQSGPPKMQAIWSSAATTDSHPPTISQWLPGLAATSGNIMRRRLFGDFLRRYPRCAFDQPERARMIVALEHREVGEDRKRVVEGKSVSVRVDLGGGRIIKKKNTK